MASLSRSAGPIHLGLDVHKDSISVAILELHAEAPEVERIFHDEASVRRLIARFEDPRRLRACYEAGPTGYELHRLLCSIGVRCQVIAPSLIPKAPGERIKTDRRDARRLARLHRAGELTAIRVLAGDPVNHTDLSGRVSIKCVVNCLWSNQSGALRYTGIISFCTFFVWVCKLTGVSCFTALACILAAIIAGFWYVYSCWNRC